MMRTEFTLSELPVPLVFAAHRTIKDCNPEFAALFGYDRDELLETGFHVLYPSFTDFVRTGKMWRTNMSGNRIYYDERIMQKRDHTRFWCKVHGRAFVPDDPFAEAVYCFQPLQRPVSTATRDLTNRQLQIVTLVAQGKTSQAIADEIGLSVRTVEAHRARIMKAIGVRNSAELTAWFQSTHSTPALPSGE